ncbi:MAG: ATP-binding domain-containing protein [Lewinellaceae bacterium]|nr:ATP-binding domain-containing protein [Lewinellaceae bacterium]
MALEVRHNPFEHTHENIAFRELANLLSQRFQRKGADGLLIGNPQIPADEWLHPDILLFTPQSIFIIDLKNYGGNVRLPSERDFSNQIWDCDGAPVKGGSFINPFVQLGSHRRKAIGVLNSVPQEERAYYLGLEPRHIVTMVYFHKTVKLSRAVPGKFEKSFFITGPDTILNLIEDIVSSSLDLKTHHFEWFKRLFIAIPYNLQETAAQKTAVKNEPDTSLWPEQQRVLHEFESFLRSEEERIFILAGPEYCGKSFLIPHLQDKAFETGVMQVELLAPTARIGNRLKERQRLQFNSLYSYIYGGNNYSDTGEEKEPSAAKEEAEEEEEASIEVVPLRPDSNLEENGICIFDEAHLITDSFHQTELLRFGSGHLLSDLLQFVKLEETNRKLVFIGDPYQLSFGKVEESALQPNYWREICEYGIRQVKMAPNKEKAISGSRAAQNLKLAASIDENLYNKLLFQDAEDVNLIPRKEIPKLLENWLNQKSQFLVLTFSNEQAEEVNQWIRKKLLNQPEGLAKGDLLFLNNSINVQSEDPFAIPRFLVNGTFMAVSRLGEERVESVKLKGRQQPTLLFFREMEVILADGNEPLKLWSLENYRTSLKGKLSKEEAIAFRVILNRRLKAKKKETPFEESEEYRGWEKSDEYKGLYERLRELKQRLDQGEKVKGQLEETEKEIRKAERKLKKSYHYRLRWQIQKTDPLINAAHLRFGWAMTVHKSLGSRWPHILFNADQGEHQGHTNRPYFQWLYTGVSRAEGPLHLINFEPIDPLDNLQIEENIALITEMDKPDTPKLTFDAEGPLQAEEVKFAEGLGYDMDNLQLIRCGAFVNNQVSRIGLKITSVAHKNYHEIYHLEGKGGRQARLTLYYDKHYHFKSPVVQKASPSGLQSELLQFLQGEVLPGALWAQLSPSFKIPVYSKWKDRLEEKGWPLSVLAQHAFKDVLVARNKEYWITFELIYNGDGFFQSLQPVKSNKPEAWKEIEAIIKATCP